MSIDSPRADYLGMTVTNDEQAISTARLTLLLHSGAIDYRLSRCGDREEIFRLNNDIDTYN